MANSCKYYKQRREMSYDGVTWIPLDEYRKGDLVPGASSDCSSPTPTLYRWVQTEDTICVSTFDGKFKAIYLGGSEYELPCDGNTTLTSGDTKPSGYQYTAMTSAEIGCVTSIGARAFDHCTSLTNITIPNGVTNIGNNAFSDCESLTSIVIPPGVTAINNQVFWGCSGLTSITIPANVTSIGSGVFYNCTSLTSVNLPNSISSIGSGAFQYCTGLTMVNIPTGVTSIDNYTFSDCSGLTSIVIPDSVISIGEYTFYKCVGLTSVSIPNGVTNIGTMAFYGCTGLTSVTCLATTPPTIVGNAFNSTNNCPIYVPSGSVDTYKAASGWSNYSSRIQAIS